MATTTIIDEQGVIVNVVDPSKAVRKLPSYGRWLAFLHGRGHARKMNIPPTMGYTVGRDFTAKPDKKTGEYPMAKVPTVVAPARTQTVTLDQAPPIVFPDGSVGIPCIACGLLSCPSCGLPGIDAESKCCTEVTLTPEDRAAMVVTLASASPKVTTLQRATMRLALRRQPMKMGKVTVGCRVKMEDVEQEVEAEKTVRTVGKPVSKSGLACRACVALFLNTIESTAHANKEREALAEAYRTIILQDEEIAYNAGFRVAAAAGKTNAEAHTIGLASLRAQRVEMAKQNVRIPGPLTPVLDVTEQVMEASL